MKLFFPCPDQFLAALSNIPNIIYGVSQNTSYYYAACNVASSAQTVKFYELIAWNFHLDIDG